MSNTTAQDLRLIVIVNKMLGFGKPLCRDFDSLSEFLPTLSAPLPEEQGAVARQDRNSYEDRGDLRMDEHFALEALSSWAFPTSSKASRLKASSTGSQRSTKPDKQVYIPVGYLGTSAIPSTPN